MKTILTLAAAIAAFATASASSAQTPAGGRWEWQTRPVSGPHRSDQPQQVRVWVKGASTEVADCNCAMMKMSAADCMKGMPGSGRAPSNG